ncbi:hypothetical protein BJF90_39295 [Pseudonocardia sp. CNS-004]|nr:hypothetical protein BJF90_39295 [Pseudonocardia sp. CNS-004]
MNEFIKFEGYYVEYGPGGGVNVGTPSTHITLGNGTTVEIPTPFMRIDRNLAITPAIVPDGESALRIDFTRWSPLRFGTDLTAGFPFNFPTQDLAVRVARAFDADPRTSWRDTPDAIGTWLRAWVADNEQDLSLPPGGAR